MTTTTITAKTNLEQYQEDLEQLQRLEDEAESSLSAVVASPHWIPSDYERLYLPALRMVGIPNKETVVLQNVADVHTHTQWSDGDDLERLLDAAMRVGLDAVAITDHDEIGGALEARRIVHERRLPLAIIPGIEVSSSDGHIGALFVTQRIPKDRNAAETVRLIHEVGGIAVAHHPYTPEWLEKILRVKLACGDLIKEVPFDAIECTNAVPGRGVKYNIAAIDEMRRARINVAITGGSDAHAAMFVGKGRTYYAGNEGVLSLKTALHHGFTHGAEGYWKASEKIFYYTHLVSAIARNMFKKFSSIN